MTELEKTQIKAEFLEKLQSFAQTLEEYVSTTDKEWTIKGFIDVFENIYTISADTKIISKILEIHLFSKFLEFANENNYELVLAEKQNWYPDVSFVSKENLEIKFAVDLKTTFRLESNPAFCNGFTLGSHGEYFINRNSTKNIQFPYSQYLGHYCLGVLYSRKALTYLEEAKIYKRENLAEIPSVIGDFEFFACEKWRIASDKRGSGNTANIGSIIYIKDILNYNGIFAKLGEQWFDEYWINYGKIAVAGVTTKSGKPLYITNLFDYLRFRGKDESWIAENIIPKMTGATLKRIKEKAK
ncbi:MAG: type II restriction endonuclease [Pyrinomonadaceae bacterium]